MSQSTDGLTRSASSHPRPLSLYDQSRRATGLPGDWDFPVAVSQGCRR
jgi:hypothetical protein